MSILHNYTTGLKIYCLHLYYKLQQVSADTDRPLTPNVLYTKVDAQCDKLAINEVASLSL